MYWEELVEDRALKLDRSHRNLNRDGADHFIRNSFEVALELCRSRARAGNGGFPSYLRVIKRLRLLLSEQSCRPAAKTGAAAFVLSLRRSTAAKGAVRVPACDGWQL